MSAPGDPPRLCAELGAGDPLHQALAAARADGPSEAELEALWQRLVSIPPAPGDGGPGGEGPPAGPPLGPGDGATAAGTSALGSVGAKLAAVLALSAAVALSASPGDAPQPSSPAICGWTPAASWQRTPRAAPPAAPDAPALEIITREPAPSPGAHHPLTAPASEVSLLLRARAALGGAPAEALRLAGEAERLYPRGRLGQEREVIRIQALIALGRRAEAAALGRAWLAQSPGSAYARRLATLLPEIAAP